MCITATELVESHFWLQGCSTDPELEVYDLSTADLFSSDEENLMETSAQDTVLSTVTKEAAPLVKYENFSQFSKIVRVIGWVKRFIFNLQNSHRRLMDSLTQLELKESETFLLMSIQREAYFEDINALQKNQPVAKKSGLYKLGPFLGEDGLLRIKGRLQMSNVLSYAEKHPILLPNCHGKDGLVRAATVKTANGEVIRAIQRLHRLEISQSQPRDPKESETVSCKQGTKGCQMI
ncbi:retrovirus-related Pol polyprotein from transposon 17.6 [Elysia marginata]|uniref:Retrovirus-related Pol polyprotein from transposon 17.6 n=1 Tax=Elysia marginata TaxID=1093978 RepID=A0AAV4JW24_9GAST|nr:retrovirus-related Pol polyprotein from transposon 17.6 [Elysia marginata]